MGKGSERKKKKEERRKRRRRERKSTSNFLPSCWLLSDMNEQAALQVDTIQVY